MYRAYFVFILFSVLLTCKDKKKWIVVLPICYMSSVRVGSCLDQNSPSSLCGAVQCDCHNDGSLGELVMHNREKQKYTCSAACAFLSCTVVMIAMKSSGTFQKGLLLLNVDIQQHHAANYEVSSWYQVLKTATYFQKIYHH